jgi:hypothetical protein
VVSLLAEYKRANPRISLEGVDYLREAGKAQHIKAKYDLNFPNATNLIIFDCEGKKPLVVDGNMLTVYTMDEIPNETEREYRKRPVEFNGERLFTGALLTVTSTNQFHAYFLEGDGEHPFTSGDQTYGYSKFAEIAAVNRAAPTRLSLEGTNAVPRDGVLIIAGPRRKLNDVALQKIEDYLNQGGRLMALFNFYTTNRETGLEKILAKWGVAVGNSIIRDVDDKTFSGRDIIVDITSKHALVNALITMQLQLIEPRSIGKLKMANPPADAPQVEEVGFTGPRAFPVDDITARRKYPLIVAVEKGAIKGMITERGATRIVVAGDSLFLDNQQIGAAANTDFANSSLNWLLAQNQMLEGISPRPVYNNRVVMSTKQLQRAEWILIAGMPGTILVLGAFVWLRRRK